MNLAELKLNNIEDGEGVRTAIFVSGCRHHCPDCFNEVTWDFDYGEKWTEETEQKIIEATKPEWINGITLLGGEPFEPENQKALLSFLKKVRKELPDKDVWCYSGFTFEQITGKEKSRAFTDISEEMLSYIDILVDGRFEKDKKNITLKFRGSENQRIIDVKKSLELNEIIIYLD